MIQTYFHIYKILKEELNRSNNKKKKKREIHKLLVTSTTSLLVNKGHTDEEDEEQKNYLASKCVIKALKPCYYPFTRSPLYMPVTTKQQFH